MINVHLPSQLAGLADGHKKLTVQATTLGEVFRRIDELAPMIRSQIFDSTGAIRPFVGLFLDDRQINEPGDSLLPVYEGSQVLILMAVAGG